jgi:coiled-coil domain-containing protein 12
MSTLNSSLSAAADERKSRLAKLKSLKRKQPADEEPAPAGLEAPPKSPSQPAAKYDDVARIHLSGRNYDLEAKGPKLGFEAPPIPDQPTLEEQAAQLEVEVKLRAAQDAQDDAGIDLFKLQPKKPNWDLKRDLDQKLEILNVRTDNAIAKMIRERISKAEKGGRDRALTSGEETVGVDGNTLVEGLRLREQEEEEDERREREAEMEA